MFITSGHSAAAPTPGAGCMSWPEPRFLIIEPSDGFDRQGRIDAQRDFIVFDFTDPPSSRFEALRVVLLRASQNRIALRGPLLFSAGLLPEAKVKRLSRAVKKNPWYFETATNPERGQMTLLVLGHAIVENPLFLTFFSNLHPKITEAMTASCLTTLQQHLVRRKGANA